VLDHPQVVEVFSPEMLADIRPASYFEAKLEPLYSDLKLRPAIALFWWYALRVATILEADDQEHREAEFAAALRRCLDALSLTSIEINELRWELDVACVTGHLARAFRILDELKFRPEAKARSSAIVRALFRLDQLTTERPPSGSWDEGIRFPDGEFAFPGYSMLAWVYATSIKDVRQPPSADRPATLRKGVDLLMLRTMRFWLEETKQYDSQLPPHMLAIEAWLTYALGLHAGQRVDLERAARIFETLPDSGAGMAVIDRGMAYEAAVMAFQDAGLLESALECARAWRHPGPNRAADWRIAELLGRLGRTEEMIKAIQDAVPETEHSDDAWKDTQLLKLGLENLAAHQVSTAIQSLAKSTPLRVQGEELCGWLFPWFHHLAPKARDWIWSGLYSVSNRELQAHTGDPAFANAADNFGEAMAWELKEVVLKPFFATVTITEVGPLSEKSPWKKLAERRAALGDVVACFQEVPKAKPGIGRQFGAWLRENHPMLLSQFDDPKFSFSLSTANGIRTRAQHGDITRDEVRQIFEIVRRVMAALHPQSEED
jgi:hypothetical protein